MAIKIESRVVQEPNLELMQIIFIDFRLDFEAWFFISASFPINSAILLNHQT